VGFLPILWCSQSGDDPQEVVAKFGYKINMKVSFKISFYIFGFVLDSCIEIWWFFLKFGGILADKNLKKHLILALLIFNIPFWLYIASKEKSATNTLSFQAQFWHLFWRFYGSSLLICKLTLLVIFPTVQAERVLHVVLWVKLTSRTWSISLLA
jgi:hypothetical protein